MPISLLRTTQGELHVTGAELRRRWFQIPDDMIAARTVEFWTSKLHDFVEDGRNLVCGSMHAQVHFSFFGLCE